MAKQRKLSKAEEKRKEQFEVTCQELEAKGYVKKDLTVSVLMANVMAFVVTLPFLILMGWLYHKFNPVGRTIFPPYMILAALLIFFGLTILHELIHGITWGLFAQEHFHSVAFGFIWSMMTPYCTCTEAMKKGQYLLGCAMPTLLLGFVPTLISVRNGSYLLFLLGEVMILAGGGDFYIILKVLLYRADGKMALYHDHPYECGVVVFEKKEPYFFR